MSVLHYGCWELRNGDGQSEASDVLGYILLGSSLDLAQRALLGHLGQVRVEGQVQEGLPLSRPGFRVSPSRSLITEHMGHVGRGGQREGESPATPG